MGEGCGRFAQNVRVVARSGRRCRWQPERVSRGEQSIVVGNHGCQVVAQACGGSQVDRVKCAELGRIEIRCSVEKDVIEPDEMDAGQELAGFWDQAGDTGTTHDSHQFHPYERC